MSGRAKFFHPLQNDFDWAAFFRRALRRGGLWADLFWEKTWHHHLGQVDATLRDLSSGIDEGLALRIVRSDGSVALGITTELTAEALNSLADRVAQSGSEENLSLGPRPLAASSTAGPSLRAPELRARDVGLERKLELLKRAQGLCAGHPEIRQARIDYREDLRQIFVARSDGPSLTDEKNMLSLACTLTGEGQNGLQRAYQRVGGRWGFEHFEEETPEKLSSEVLRQFKSLLSAKPAPSGAMPVVLGPRAGGTLCHEAVGHGLEADAAERGLSAYSGLVGEKVASEKITFIDDGTLDQAMGSQNIDDEGEPGQRTVLIENGELKTYMYDQRTARLRGKSSTGNGRRESYRHPPLARMTNTYIAPGPDDAQKILSDTSWGLYVARMGGGSVDTSTGNFLFHATEAYLIRDGAVGEAVTGASIIGNGPRVMREVDRVGAQVGWFVGQCGKSSQTVPVSAGQPTLRVPELTVGGLVSVKEYFAGRS